MVPPPDRAPSQLSQYRRLAFEIASVFTGVVLFFVLVAELMLPAGLLADGFMAPPLVGVVGLILLWPLREHRVIRALLLSGGLLLLLWMLHRLSVVLLPFVLTYLLAYLFDPLVVALRTRWRVPRWVSALVVTALLGGAFGLVVFLLVPSLVDQLEALGRRLLLALADLRAWLITTSALETLEDTGLVDKAELIDQITVVIQDQANALTSSIPNAFQQIVRSLGSLLGVLTMITITPVILFYLLKDYPFIKARLVELFPTIRGRRDYLVKAGTVVGSYLRGQLTISAIAAFNVSVALILLDVPFALLIGLLGGLLNMVPNLGILITNVVGILLAFVFGDPWLVDVVAVVAVLMAQSLLEQAFLTPKILSYEVGLHPVLILLSLFVFGYLLGIFGLLIAVPATALIMTVYKTYRHEMTLELEQVSAPPEPAAPAPAPAVTEPAEPGPS